jgi:hypothetical protein
MPKPLVQGFDTERMARQQTFLLDRASAHDSAEDAKSLWHAACAASLTRDAAAIALLRGEVDDAINLFRKAGQRFATLGVFAGFALLEFSDSGEARRWRTKRENLNDRVRQLIAGEEQIRPDNTSEPFLSASASSPRQLLYLYQAEVVAGDDDVFMRERIREKLLLLPELPVGPTSTPLAGYLMLLDEVAEKSSGGEPDLSSGARDTLLSLVLRRREQLNAAQADRWHWKMLLNPTDLIDLDLVTLGIAMIDRWGSTAAFDNAAVDRGNLVALPLQAAKLLRHAL